MIRLSLVLGVSIAVFLTFSGLAQEKECPKYKMQKYKCCPEKQTMKKCCPEKQGIQKQEKRKKRIGVKMYRQKQQKKCPHKCKECRKIEKKLAEKRRKMLLRRLPKQEFQKRIGQAFKELHRKIERLAKRIERLERMLEKRHKKRKPEKPRAWVEIKPFCKKDCPCPWCPDKWMKHYYKYWRWTPKKEWWWTPEEGWRKWKPEHPKWREYFKRRPCPKKWRWYRHRKPCPEKKPCPKKWRWYPHRKPCPEEKPCPFKRRKPDFGRLKILLEESRDYLKYIPSIIRAAKYMLEKYKENPEKFMKDLKTLKRIIERFFREREHKQKNMFSKITKAIKDSLKEYRKKKLSF
jgi:hypothetical protein